MSEAKRHSETDGDHLREVIARIDALDRPTGAGHGLPPSEMADFALALESFHAPVTAECPADDPRRGTMEHGAAMRAQATACRQAQLAGDGVGHRAAPNRERAQALKAKRKDLRQRMETADFDPVTAMAMGLVRDGQTLKALAPTPQLGQMAVRVKNRPPLLTGRQLAALKVFHDAWLSSQTGLAAVDPAQIRVDGGGGGDASWRLAAASDSLREFRRLRRAVGDPLHLALLDHLIIYDQDLHSFVEGAICLFETEKIRNGMRIAALLAGADAIARQLWG